MVPTLSSAEWTTPTWGKERLSATTVGDGAWVVDKDFEILSRQPVTEKLQLLLHLHRNRFVSLAFHYKPVLLVVAGYTIHLLTYAAAHTTTFIMSEKPLPFIYQFAAGMLPQTQYAIGLY